MLFYLCVGAKRCVLFSMPLDLECCGVNIYN